jgi:pimeloyl-ACP methyl ester carboxylesterase
MVRNNDTCDALVAGGRLRVHSWGASDAVILGIHGITASGVSFRPVVRHLSQDWRLIAPDLRGRGGSASLPGPYGMRAHADDCVSVLEHFGISSAVVVGESMGAYVAVVLAAARPDLVRHLVLVDGGLPPHLPEAVGAEDLVQAVLGPVLTRLRTTYPTLEACRELWRAHPSLTGHWNEDVQAYIDYEMRPADGGFRSTVREEAVRADLAEPIVEASIVEDSLRQLRCPVMLLRAERNLVNQLPPILPNEVVDIWRIHIPQLIDEVVPDSNHYTIFFDSDKAARIARAAMA